MGFEDVPKGVDIGGTFGDGMGEEVVGAAADVGEDFVLREFGKGEVATRVVDGRGEVGAGIDEGSVHIKKDCVHKWVSFRIELLWDGDVDGNGQAGEGLIEVGGFHDDEDAAVARIDVDFGQVVDGFLDVDGHALAGAEGRGAADVVAAVAVGRIGCASCDGFDAALAREVFR